MDDEELDELVSRVEQVREQPWNKPTGRPRKLSLRDAVTITCAYSRQNIIQEVLAEWWDVSQEIISDMEGDVVYISNPVPGSTHDSVAIDATPVAAILEHSGGAIADRGYQGCGYVTPRKKPKGGELSVGDKESNKHISRLRAPIERVIAHIKSWRILHTDYRRPLRTYRTSFLATIGLFFFKGSFQ